MNNLYNYFLIHPLAQQNNRKITHFVINGFEKC